jgi:hypothetical protein
MRAAVSGHESDRDDGAILSPFCRSSSRPGAPEDRRPRAGSARVSRGVWHGRVNAIGRCGAVTWRTGRHLPDPRTGRWRASTARPCGRVARRRVFFFLVGKYAHLFARPRRADSPTYRVARRVPSQRRC